MIDLALAHGWMANLTQAATGSLMAAVWQGILLAAAAWLGLRLLPKTPAAVRFAIWFGVFLLVTTLPLMTLWPHSRSGSAPGGHGPWLTIDARWSLAIAVTWAAASVWRAAQLAVAAFRVRALWKRAKPVQVGAANVLHPTHRDGTAMDGAPGLNVPGILRRAELCTSDEVDRPTVIGFFAPKILIPRWLLERLTLAELEQVVLHESGHLGRADDWMNLLQKIALMVFPLNPALAWVERRLCFERELACDERVLRATGAPKAYAACLATLAEHRLQRRGLGLALAIGVLGRESELGQRVRRILRRGTQMKPLHARVVLGGAMLGLVVAATGLERCPQLVGFSSAGSAGNREQATGISPLRGYGVQPVMMRVQVGQAQDWKPIGDGVRPAKNRLSNSELARKQEVSGESVAGVRTTNLSQGGPAAGATRPARMVQVGATDSGRSQAGDVVITQWTVVTSWRGEEGSRMVMTTARVSNPTPSMSDRENETSAAQETPRYAAVPVRGGWLVFQL